MLISEVLSAESPVSAPAAPLELRSAQSLQKNDAVLSRMDHLALQLDSKSAPVDLLTQLQECIANLRGEFSDNQKMQAWKISYKIWNACVEMGNNHEKITLHHAKLRQVACDLLFTVGTVGAIQSALLKMATLFFKSGIIWQKIPDHSMASLGFEKATEILSKRKGKNGVWCVEAEEEQKLMFDLCLARSRSAWELSHKALASSLLGRARSLLCNDTQKHQELAELYFLYGRALMSKEDAESRSDSIKYMEQAFEVCCESLSLCREEMLKQKLDQLKFTILRYITAGYLENGNFESVLKCVVKLKEAPDHASTPFLAFKALAGLNRLDEAEKELFTLVSHHKSAIGACISAIESLIQASDRLDAAKKAFFMLQSRFPSSNELPVRILEKLLKQASVLDDKCKKRIQVALEIATNENIVARFQSKNDKERESMHAMLWNSGSDYFQAKDYHFSIKFFEASMLYLAAGIEGNPMRAKALRVLCLCHIGLLQYDRANEYVDGAEKLEPNMACIFLKFKICLQLDDEVGAAKQVEKMIKCVDFEPDYLTLASHEAMACKSTKVAVSALSSLLNLRPPGMREINIYRNLLSLALEDLKCQTDCLKYLKKALARMAELGAERLFGSGDIGQKEATWFAGCSWNQGLAAAKSQNWKLCAEFFACASEFYSAFEDFMDNRQYLETSLLLTIAAILAQEGQDDPGQLKMASIYLERCRKIHLLILSQPNCTSLNENFNVYLSILAFHLKGRTKEHKEQLEILYHCNSMPQCTADLFFKMAMDSYTAGYKPEVTSAAFHACLDRLLGSTPPDYRRAAIAMRRLIVVADVQNKDGPDVLKLYKEAYRIIVGLNDGDYPSVETQWLVSTAWNRAALQHKLSHVAEAEQWMNLALDLLKHSPAMAHYRPAMMESLTELLKQKCRTASDMEE